METYIVMSFKSTHDAIKAETLVKRNNVDARLIPLPPEVSAGCGLALRLKEEDKNRVIKILEESLVTPDGVYEMTKEDGRRKVKKLNG